VLAKAYSLIEELEDVLQSIINSGDPELLKKKQQIEVINTTMEQLLSCDLPVPDDLTSRKKSLEAEIAWMDDPDLALPLIRDELVELIGKIDVSLKDSRKGSVKPIVPEKDQTSTRISYKPDSPREIYMPGEITERDKLRAVLIGVLRDMGGSGQVSEIKAEISKRLGDQFTDKDKEIISDGGFRWWNNTRWVRQNLTTQGILKNDSPRGIWELK